MRPEACRQSRGWARKEDSTAKGMARWKNPEFLLCAVCAILRSSPRRVSHMKRTHHQTWKTPTKQQPGLALVPNPQRTSPGALKFLAT